MISRIDLFVFLLLTAVCGLIVQFNPGRQYLVGLLAMPIFLAAVFKGVREKAPLLQMVNSEL